VREKSPRGRRDITGPATSPLEAFAKLIGERQRAFSARLRLSRSRNGPPTACASCHSGRAVAGLSKAVARPRNADIYQLDKTMWDGLDVRDSSCA